MEADGDCKDITLDDCYFKHLPLYSPYDRFVDAGSKEKCQSLCANKSEKCRFFVYNQRLDYCELFDFDMRIYEGSCRTKGGSPSTNFFECLESEGRSVSLICK